MNPIAISNIAAGILGAFAGAYLAKSIELQNEFGEYYFFLKGSKKARWFCSVYELVGAAFLLLVSYTKVISPEHVPDFSFAGMQGQTGQSSEIHSVFYVLLTSVIVGLSSKGMMDMPIAKARSEDETHFKVKDIVAFIFPEVKKSFRNIIRSNEIAYFDKRIQDIQQQNVKLIAKKVYDWLHGKLGWETEEKQRELDLMMTSLNKMTDGYEALRYLFRNLGREEFEYVFKINH